MFYAGAFTIKNLPTPYSVWPEYPPIKINFYNGTGGIGYSGDKFMYDALAYPKISTAPITRFGIDLTKVLFSSETGKTVHPYYDDDDEDDDFDGPVLDPAKIQHVNALDIYFTPSVAIFNCSIIEYSIPKEITLPTKITNIDQITDEFRLDPWEKIPCEAIQGLDTETIECYH